MGHLENSEKCDRAATPKSEWTAICAWYRSGRDRTVADAKEEDPSAGTEAAAFALEGRLMDDREAARDLPCAGHPDR